MDIDVTYLFQFGILLVALVGLNGILLKPFQKVIEERDAKIDGATAEVDVLQSAGDEAMAAYQRRMREAKLEAQAARDELKNDGRDRERKLLAEVRAEIADKLNDARAEVQNAEAGARKEIASETGDMARLLAGKILSREVAA